jgi:hypothetical protein
MLYRLVDGYGRFEKSCCPKYSEFSTAFLLDWLYMKIKAELSTETSVTVYHSKRLKVPEDLCRHQHLNRYFNLAYINKPNTFQTTAYSILTTWRKTWNHNDMLISTVSVRALINGPCRESRDLSPSSYRGGSGLMPVLITQVFSYYFDFLLPVKLNRFFKLLILSFFTDAVWT